MTYRYKHFPHILNVRDNFIKATKIHGEAPSTWFTNEMDPRQGRCLGRLDDLKSQ